MSGYKLLKQPSTGWIVFKILWPILFVIISIIIFVIAVIVTIAVNDLLPGVGTAIVGLFDTGVVLGIIAAFLWLIILTLYRVYKRNLPLDSSYTWFCYILYSFLPGGSIITSYELA